MRTHRLSFVFILLFLVMSVKWSDAQDLNQTVKGNNEFTFSVYGEVNNHPDNVFFSPYSISSALAMTYTGADGVTQKEMAEVFHFLEDKKMLSKHFSQLNTQFEKYAEEKIQLNIANSLWCQQDYQFRKAFLDINRTYYNAGIHNVNFRDDYKQIRNDINTWVEDKTENKIKDLIKRGMLDNMTRLVLVNAIYFKGMWEHPFKEKDTREDTFYLYSTCKTQAKFMNKTLSLNYYEDGVAQVVEIPYSGEKLSMMVILPKKKYGMEELESRLSQDLYRTYLGSMHTKKVDLSLPKFTVNAEYELSKVLKEMGMKSAFGEGADFSEMTGNKDLFINNIVHKSFVDVNEEGTEAAAATGVVMRKTSAIMETVEFKADHPFIFLIKDRETNSILFMGRLMNPRK